RDGDAAGAGDPRSCPRHARPSGRPRRRAAFAGRARARPPGRRRRGAGAVSTFQMLAFIAVLIVTLLLAGAFLSWIERRVLAWWQDRYGPNRAGPFGVLQALADVVKILMKEDWIPPLADKPVFVIAPAIVAVTTLIAFAVVPFAPGLAIADMNLGLLFFLAVMSLSVYSVTFAG